MDSEIQASKEVNQATQGLFHPLAECELTYLPRSCSNPASIDFSDPQPVFLNGNVYMKGCKQNGKYRIWKYSSSANVFSEILAPEWISDKFVLISYKSQLLLIDAALEEPDESDEDNATCYPEYMLHKLHIDQWILVNENKFERTTAVPHYVHRSGNPMPWPNGDDEHVECEPLEPEYWEIRATSKDGNLLVAFYRQDCLLDPYDVPDDYQPEWFITVDILLFEKSKNEWKFVATRNNNTDKNYKCNDDDDGSESSTDEATADHETIIDRPSITIGCNDTLYVKLWNERNYKDDKNYCELNKISIKCLLSDRGYPNWQDLPSLTLPKGHSNLSVLNNQIVVVIPRDEELFILALLESKPNDIWIEIAHVKLDTKFDSTPCIMGLPDDGSILIIGMMKSPCQSGIQTSMLKTLKLTSKVATYIPTSQLSLSKINKLEIGMGVCILSNLEKDRIRLQELAGFELNCSHNYTFYTKSLIPKYIKSWAESSNCGLTLTWNNFLRILKELRLTDVAEHIEKFLIEFSEVHEHHFQAPDATGGEEIADLRGKLDVFHQELNREKATEAPSLDLIKEKVKACFDQSKIVFYKVRMERACLQEQIDELRKQKLELESKVEALEQGPPVKRLCLSKSEENDTAFTHRGEERKAYECKIESLQKPQADQVEHQPRATPTLQLLLKKLLSKVASKWENIGALLGVDDGHLSSIKADNHGDSGDCLRELLCIWLKKADPPPSWNDIVEALECLGEEKLAQELNRKYCTQKSR